MKKSNIFAKLVLFIIVVGILGGVGYYYFFLREGKTLDTGIIPSLSGNKVSDVKNGVYIIKNKTDRVKNFLKNCVVESVNDYLVVINSDYMLYHGNCLNMVFVGKGKIDNLKFDKTNDSKYSVTLDDKTYTKDDSITNIQVGNNVVGNIRTINYDIMKYIIDYSEYKGYYYSFDIKLAADNGYSAGYSYNKDNGVFTFSLAGKIARYEKVLDAYNAIPEFYFINKNIVIVDKKKVNNDYKGELYIYSENGKTFDFNNIIPLNVNGVVIDSSWNRIFRFDNDSKIAYVLFSKSNDICDFNNNNVYYEFKLVYDYKKAGFGSPDLYKKGSSEKDCSYAKKYYLKEA